MLLVLVFGADSLQEFRFSHPSFAGKKARRSVRGRSYIPPYEGCFTWDRGVQAFVLLILQEILARADESEDTASLTGGADTPASTLDYALDRNTAWMREVFGTDKEGTSLIKHLVERSNPRRRSGGDVSVRLRTRTRSSLNIQAVWSGSNRPVTREELQGLITSIDRLFSPQRSTTPTVATRESRALSDSGNQVSSRITDQALFNLIESEVLHSLTSTDIFSVSSYASALDAMTKAEPFAKLARGGLSLSLPIDSGIKGRYRIGAPREVIESLRPDSMPPVRMACPLSDVGTIAIFKYLISNELLNASIDYSYVHSIELLDLMTTESFHQPVTLVVLGVGQTAYFLGKGTSNYSPLVQLPSLSYGTILRGSSLNPNRDNLFRGYFGFLSDPRSNSSFYHHALLEAHKITNKKTSNVFMEPFEITRRLAEGDTDLRAITFFPYTECNILFNDAHLWQPTVSMRQSTDLFLFAHESIIKDNQLATYLTLAIRHAWSHLIESKSDRDKVIAEIVADPAFVSFLMKASGLSHQAHLRNRGSELGGIKTNTLPAV